MRHRRCRGATPALVMGALAAMATLAAGPHAARAQSGMMEFRGATASDALSLSPVTFDFSPPADRAADGAGLELPSRAGTANKNMVLLEKLLAVDDAPAAVSAFLAGGKGERPLAERGQDAMLSRFLESGITPAGRETGNPARHSTIAGGPAGSGIIAGNPTRIGAARVSAPASEELTLAPSSHPVAATRKGARATAVNTHTTAQTADAPVSEAPRLSPDETFQLSTKVESVKSHGEFLIHDWNGFATPDNPVAPPPAHPRQGGGAGGTGAMGGTPGRGSTTPTLARAGSSKDLSHARADAGTSPGASVAARPDAQAGTTTGPRGHALTPLTATAGGLAFAAQTQGLAGDPSGSDPFVLPNFDRSSYRLGSSFLLGSRGEGNFSLTETEGLAERVMAGQSLLSLSSRYRLRDSLRLQAGYAQESGQADQGKQRPQSTTFWTGVLFNF